MNDSLWPHGLQHTSLPCHSLSPGICSNSCPLSWWCHPTVSFSVTPFSSCPQSFPASGSFPKNHLFTSGGQNIGTSVSALVLPRNIRGWPDNIKTIFTVFPFTFLYIYKYIYSYFYKTGIILIFNFVFCFLDFPCDSTVKTPPTNSEDGGLIPRSERSPGWGNGSPLQYFHLGMPVFSSGKYHGQRSLSDCSLWGHTESDIT